VTEDCEALNAAQAASETDSFTAYRYAQFDALVMGELIELLQ
jgi:hypothetical protein